MRTPHTTAGGAIFSRLPLLLKGRQGSHGDEGVRVIWGLIYCLCVPRMGWCVVSRHHGAIFGGACVGVRAQAPTLSDIHKEQMGLATHDSATATQ